MDLIYALFLEPEVHDARHELPGHMRQRVRRLIDSLASDPRPSSSTTLGTEGLALPPDITIRRARIERWRVIYAVNDTERWVWVLAIRRRPPYDYDDLSELVQKLQ